MRSRRFRGHAMTFGIGKKHGNSSSWDSQNLSWLGKPSFWGHDWCQNSQFVWYTSINTSHYYLSFYRPVFSKKYSCVWLQFRQFQYHEAWLSSLNISVERLLSFSSGVLLLVILDIRHPSGAEASVVTPLSFGFISWSLPFNSKRLLPPLSSVTPVSNTEAFPT